MRPKLLLFVVLFGFAFGFPLDLTSPGRYYSETTVELRGATAREAAYQIRDEFLSRTGLSQEINDPQIKLYEDKLRRMPLEDVIEVMRKDLSVKVASASPEVATMSIRFGYRDPVKAKRTVKSIADQVIRNRPRVSLVGMNRDQVAAAAFRNLEVRLARLEGRSVDPDGGGQAGFVAKVVLAPTEPIGEWKFSSAAQDSVLLWFEVTGMVGFIAWVLVRVFERERLVLE